MAYSPCINQGILAGMGKSQEEEKLAVQSGYWPLYRYNPALKAEGKNPLSLDSKKPDGTLRRFLEGEIRYASLKRTFPQEADRLNAALEEQFNARYEQLALLADPTIVCKEPETAQPETAK
jgi:pyruvate-ferredoxin/flavodoxin oxidoreductase